MNDIEIWKPIPGFESAYEVSNMGRVKSLPRLVIAGCCSGIKAGRFLRHRIVGAGYCQLVLFKNGIRLTKYVHVLVAEMFCEKKPGHIEVNHLDTDKTNNVASNLEWSTRLQNLRHARAAGCFQKYDKWRRGNRRNLGVVLPYTGPSRKERRQAILSK